MCSSSTSSLDPYEGSYTWFEIAVARGDDILPITLEIQRNKRGKSAIFSVRGRIVLTCLHLAADREVQYYEHEISLESPVIQQIRRGDKLVLLAKAMFPVSFTSTEYCWYDGYLASSVVFSLLHRAGKIG